MMLYALPDATVAIIDVFIIVGLLAGTIIGFYRGFLNSSVKFLGLLIMIIGGYFLKNPISIFLYKNFPFFKLGGVLAGVSVVNIIIYEFIAYILILILLYIVLKILAIFTNMVDKILAFILSIGIPSQALGAVVGFMESYMILYIILFIVTFAFNFSGIKVEKSLADNIMNTPVLNNTIGTTLNAFADISELAIDFKESENKEEYNYKALDIVLKYKIISVENAKELLVTGKLNIPNSGKLISEYES